MNFGPTMRSLYAPKIAAGATPKPPKLFAAGGRVNGEHEKLSHETVGYVTKSRKTGESCGSCSMFIKRRGVAASCSLVRRPIFAAGWCERFEPKDARKGFADGGRVVGYASGGAVDDLPEAPWATGGKDDLPDAPWAADVEKPGVMSDVAKSGGVGLVKGMTGLVPAAGAGRLAAIAASRASPEARSAHPVGSLDDAIEAATGPFYKPQTVPGKFAETVGEFAPGAFAPGGLMRKASQVLVPAIASETAGQATEGTAWETPARIASAVTGAALTGRQPNVSSVMPAGLDASLAAERLGIDLPRAIATDSPLTKFAGQVALRAPGGGPMQRAAANAVEQLGGAAARGVEMAGGAADAMASGAGFKSGIETAFKPTLKARIGRAYDAVDEYIDPNFRRPLSSTQEAIADIAARRQASGESDPGKAVQLVLGGATRPGGLSYTGVKDLRTRVGEFVDTGVLPEGMSQSELRRIYGALSDDLRTTVLEGGGPQAHAAFDKANAAAKFAADWKDNLRKVLGPEGRSGEGITEAILRMASSGPSGDLKALTMARGAVPKEVWQDVAATAVSRLGLDRKGQFSPAAFLNDYAKLSPGGKNTLFRGVGSGDLVSHLNDISTVSKKFVDAGKLVNSSGTAGNNIFYTAMGGVGAGLLHGSMIEPLTALSTIVGNNMMARVLGRPLSAASIARWGRAYDKMASNPTKDAAVGFKIASTNLANTLSRQVGERIAPADVIRSIQGPVPARSQEEQ